MRVVHETTTVHHPKTTTRQKKGTRRVKRERLEQYNPAYYISNLAHPFQLQSLMSPKSSVRPSLARSSRSKKTSQREERDEICTLTLPVTQVDHQTCSTHTISPLRITASHYRPSSLRPTRRCIAVGTKRVAAEGVGDR